MYRVVAFERRFSILARETNKAKGDELIRLKGKKKELDEEYFKWKTKK